MNGQQLTAEVIADIEASGGKAINLIAASKAGNADIVACYKGKYIELEIKGRGDTEKPHQALKLNEAIEAGGYAAFVYNIWEARKILTLIDNGLPCDKVRISMESVKL